jgi:hypothetical protein
MSSVEEGVGQASQAPHPPLAERRYAPCIPSHHAMVISSDIVEIKLLKLSAVGPAQLLTSKFLCLLVPLLLAWSMKRSCRAKQDEEHREATASTADLTRTASKEGSFHRRRLRAASRSVEY